MQVCDFVFPFPDRMPGNAQSAKSITHLSRGTVFAAGLYVRIGTKMSLDSPIPFLSPTSQHAALSQPMMRKMTVTRASTSQTAAGQSLTLSSCPPTPQLTDHCPLWLQVKWKVLGPLASTRMGSSQEGGVRTTLAWKSKMRSLGNCWSLASCVECDHATEI